MSRANIVFTKDNKSPSESLQKCSAEVSDPLVFFYFLTLTVRFVGFYETRKTRKQQEKTSGLEPATAGHRSYVGKEHIGRRGANKGPRWQLFAFGFVLNFVNTHGSFMAALGHYFGDPDELYESPQRKQP